MPGEAGAARRILIDISTSLRWRGRNPVGIVRTERELAAHFLVQCPQAAFFRYEAAADTFWLLPRQAVAELLGLPCPAGAQGGLDGLAAETLLRFRPGDVVVGAGLQWDSGSMARLYAEKQRHGLFVAQVIYDIVPLLMPEYCVPGLERTFPRFILDTAWTADRIYCISDSTRRDLAGYYARIGLPAPPLARLALGSDIPAPPRAGSADELGLEASGFVLYVSTIEPRKNHRMLFEIWRRLHATDRDSLVPLDFVGHTGWNVGDLMHVIGASEALHPDYLRVLSDVSDADLDWLYRNARFTLYPSLYEGWGLPVAESLARGTVCIAADAASLPEVAGDLADLIDPLDQAAWCARIRLYLTDPAALAARADTIRGRFTPVAWSACMGRFHDDLRAALSPGA